MDKILKPLKMTERIFVKHLVVNGLSKAEAYSSAFNIGLTDDNLKELNTKADKCLKKDNVRAYYDALMEDVRDRETKKAVWTKEVATEKLMRLISKAEEDIYSGDKPITMARLSAIMQPTKELNLMHGYNQTNLNVEATALVQFCGEDDILD